MKKYLLLFPTLFSVWGLFAQQAAIIGVNEDQPDGFSFVAITDIPAGTKIYYTTEEYAGNCRFVELMEEVAYWTAPAGGLAAGQVVFIAESAEVANTFTIVCSGGEGPETCGMFTLVTGNFNIGAQDELYLYSDSDDNPVNGVDLIHSVVHHDHNMDGVSALPAGINPKGDSPCGEMTIVLDEMEDSGVASGHYDYMGPRTLPIWRESLENPVYYVVGAETKALDVTPFSGTSPAVLLEPGQFQVKVFPNPAQADLTVTLDAPLEVEALLQVRDTHGRLLRQRQLDGRDSRAQIPLTALPAGIYWLNVVSSRGQASARFVKE